VVANGRLALAFRRDGPGCQLAYTLFIVMPTNRQLEAVDSASAGSTSRALIERWGKLHAVRSALGFAATLIFPWASMS
jgi:hypothetical protein